MINSLGVMQGRLTPMVDNMIQAFPSENWEKEFAIANELNVRNIEWTIDQKDLYKNPLMSESGRRKINKLCEINNIKIPSLTGDCFMQSPFWKKSGIERENLEVDFFELLNASHQIGISMIVVPLVDNGRIENSEQEDYLVKFLTSSKEILKNYKMMILFESDYEPIRLGSFIRKFKSNLFGINYDIGNSTSMGFCPKEEFKCYGNYIYNIHVKDRIINGATVPLGEGDTNFKLIFNLLREINYDGNLIIQAARPKNGDDIAAIIKYKELIYSWLLNV
jgi:L-ribulose-5-phosphate 3-epimerase